MANKICLCLNKSPKKNQMIKQLTLLITITALLLVACNFSKGVKKDLTNGLKTIWNGFAVDEVYFTDTSGNRLSSNKIKMGNTVLITATGVENYSLKEGKAFPGCTLTITDDAGKSVLNIEDAFANLTNGASETDAQTLTASFTTGSPMETGKTYHLKARFFDKEKSSSEIVGVADIVIE
jgi:predicted small secreted protein